MKYRVFLILALFVARPLAAQQYVSQENEEIYGTWVNTDYSGGYNEEQKIVIHPDGLELYGMAAFDFHSGKDRYTILEKWKDENDNIWYKRHIFASYGKWSDLTRISQDQSVMEYVFSYVVSKIPEKIDPNHKNYRIYYRQK